LSARLPNRHSYTHNESNTTLHFWWRYHDKNIDRGLMAGRINLHLSVKKWLSRRKTKSRFAET
jgi:hypothetical protein